MAKSVAKTNQKLVAHLLSGLDLQAVQSALNRGEITPRQAQNITKFVRAAKAIRESYHRSELVFDEATSKYVGEVVSKNNGASWIGRRYGWNYPHDSAEFAEQDDAVGFVGQTLHQTVAAPKAHNAAASETAALSDPDAQPLTDADFKRMRRVPRVKTLRRALGFTQEEFAARYRIPLDTLRDWERGRIEPDQPARAYLKVIASDPDRVHRMLNAAPG